MDTSPKELDTLSSTRLNFWGVDVTLLLQSSYDISHISYYFQDYLVPVSDRVPLLSVALTSESHSFIGDRAGSLKRVHVRNHNGPWEVYDEYRNSPQRPTPFPPFALWPLNRSIRTVHASVATPPDVIGKSILLHGPSRSGKSALLLELLHRGWGFVCDDTALIEARHTTLTYSRPIGIRERTLEIHPWLAAHISRTPSFRTPTGTTWAVHPNLLLSRRAPARTAWTWTARLAPSARYAFTRQSDSEWSIAMDPALHIHRAAADLSAALIEDRT